MKYKSLLAIFITLISFSAHAEQRWFEVELLLFERNVDIKDVREHLSSQEIIVDSEQSLQYFKPKRTEVCVDGEPCLHKKSPVIINKNVLNLEAKNVKFLDSSDLQLVEQREKLEDHNSFKPLLHMAWRMPVESGRTAKPIHLFAGKNLAFNIEKRQQAEMLKQQSLATDDNQTINADLSKDDLMQAETAIEPESEVPLTDKWAIDGNFKVYLDHYLFIDSQLIIRKEVTEEVKQVEQVFEVIESENNVQIATQSEAAIVTEVELQTVVKEILFDQNRRLRSEEIHYLDHPLMGIIVQIRKIPKDELEALQAE